MIEWIKYPENEPDKEDMYLITDGCMPEFGWFSKNKVWMMPLNQPKGMLEAVTHYAHINLPLEGQKNGQ